MPELATIEKAIWKSLQKIENAVLREVKTNYAKALDSIRAELSKYAEKGVLTKAQMSKYNRLTKLDKQIRKVLSSELSKVDTKLTDLQKVQYQESFFRHSWAIDQAAEFNINWGLINEKAIKESVARFTDPAHRFYKTAIQGLTFETKRRVGRDITQGLIRGDSYDKIAKRIKDTMNRSYADSVRIGRTEGQRAAVEGQQAKYAEAKEKGVEVTEVWDATLDSRTRPSHGRMDGMEAREENGQTIFDSPDVGPIPGPVQSGDPSFDINCRCRVRGVIKDMDKPEFESERARQAYERETYSEWAERKGIKKNKYGQKL
jgi:SPP1 gp7 family putative phage head morphogenesis protein